MSYYLIGIGGTGARCMEAFIHLSGANLLKDDNPVHLINIDPDVSCGNLQEFQNSWELYNRTYEMKCKVVFGNKLEEPKAFNPVPENLETMDDVFGSGLMRTSNQKLSCLYEAMFTPEERKTDLKVGFHGHPVIGAAVLGLTMDTENDETWKSIIEQIKVDDDPRVFIFASVFGGTGASGFPNVAKILKNKIPNNKDGENKMKLGGCLMLPYFAFATPKKENGAEDELYAKFDDFIYNTTEALKYYDANKYIGDVFNSVYLIGDHEQPVQGEFALGAAEQRNNAHFIEIYAALAAFDFFNKPEEELKKPTHPMIATQSEKLTWGDFPNPCVYGDLQRKLATFIRFIYVYRAYTFGHLSRCRADKNHKKNVSWVISLVEKAGQIDLYQDTESWNRFEKLAIYCDRFLAWLEQITRNKRCEFLINRQIFDRNLLVEPYQVVFPITEQKDKLTEKVVFQELSKFKDISPTSSGAGILLEALYKICSR